MCIFQKYKMLYFQKITFGPIWVSDPKMGEIVGFGNVCGPQMGPGLAVWAEIENLYINF